MIFPIAFHKVVLNRMQIIYPLINMHYRQKITVFSSKYNKNCTNVRTKQKHVLTENTNFYIVKESTLQLYILKGESLYEPYFSSCRSYCSGGMSG